MEAYEEIALLTLKEFKATRGFEPMTSRLYVIHLITGPLGNSFVSPRISMFPGDDGNIEIRAKTKPIVSQGTSDQVFSHRAGV